MKTYYAQIKELVLPHVAFYREDITEHDKRNLRTYKGEFIHAARNSGTDLVLFDNITEPKHFEWAAAFALRSSNDLFHHGFNGQVKQITRDKALKIMAASARVCAARQAKARYADYEYSDKDSAVLRLYTRLLPDYLKSIPVS